jgi:hypothetical protein
MQESKTLTYTNALNDFEAQEEATRLVQSICKDRQYLKEQCELNGNIIMTKWKKSSKKSQAVLLDGKNATLPREFTERPFGIQTPVSICFCCLTTPDGSDRGLLRNHLFLT